MNIRLVALDLDGTLVDGRGRVGRRTAARLAEAQARGAGVVLVTGRPYAAALPVALALGVRLPLVCCHGAVVRWPEGRLWWRRRLNPEAAAAAAADLAAAGVAVSALDGDRLLAPPLDEGARAFYRQHGLRPVPVPDLAGALARRRRGPDMLVGRGRPEMLARLAQRWRGALSPHRSGPGALDLVAPGVAKEAAVAALARRLGVAPAQVLAVGDGESDAGLLAWAGVGVAVARAAPAARACADWVVPEGEEEGVAAALERFLLA